MSEFIEVINGYKYKLASSISCDGEMCSVNIKIKRFEEKTNNIDEINRYLEELITIIMKNNFKEKYKDFYTNGCLMHKKDNIYELNWIIDMKKSKYKILKEFCEGNEIEILSGELNNKKGKYIVREKGTILKKIPEYIIIGNDEYELKGNTFKFTDDYDQLSYEECE